MSYKSFKVVNPDDVGFDSNLLSTKSYRFTGDVANITKNVGNANDVSAALENLEKVYRQPHSIPDMRDTWARKDDINPFKELMDE